MFNFLFFPYFCYCELTFTDCASRADKGSVCNYNGAFHLNWEVPDGNFNWKDGQTSPTPTSESKLAALCVNKSENCSNTLFIKTSVLFVWLMCLIKSVIHTVLSNFYLWTCCYGVCMCKIPRNALISTGIANMITIANNNNWYCLFSDLLVNSGVMSFPTPTSQVNGTHHYRVCAANLTGWRLISPGVFSPAPNV